ncbi:MAG: class I SAM-dependent methyltransferase [Nitrospirae bacterium]|nr:class I SAM-dependent methyltransferase [Nitrospirota bacterium]
MPENLAEIGDSEELEIVSCPVCGNREKEAVYEGFQPFCVVRCRACGLSYLSPRKTEAALLRKYSEDDYFEGEGTGYADYIAQEEALRKTFRRFLSNLRIRGITGGDLLEVGCGYGFLLDEARGFFQRRTGMDFSRRAVELAGKRADRVFEGGIDQIPADEKYDCIIATQVIEHVYQPKAFMKKLTGRLRKGGRMVIATPDMDSFWRRLMGQRWPSFKIPEHVLFFNRGTLSSLMSDAGLTGVQPIPYPHAFPLSLIAAKLHMPFPSGFGGISLWLPATTIALCGVLPDE